MKPVCKVFVIVYNVFEIRIQSCLSCELKAVPMPGGSQSNEMNGPLTLHVIIM